MPVRKDKWVNYVTAVNSDFRDKTQNAQFELARVDYRQAEDVWRGDDMAAKLIEKPVYDLFRQGYQVLIADDTPDKAEIQKAISSELYRLDVNANLRTALEYARAYGGGAVFLGVNDGQIDLSRPLQKSSIAEFISLTLFTREELEPVKWYTDWKNKKYGSPETYKVISEFEGFDGEIHESRFVIFRGKVVSRKHLRDTQGWGDSVFVRALEVISQFHQIWGGSAHLLSDFAQAVLKIEGLAELLLGNDRKKVTDRAIALDMSRSIARTVILDTKESWERQATPMSGYPEMIQLWVQRLAACFDMPASLLFGQAPAGLNATGDSDIRWYYDGRSAYQNEVVLPPLEFIIRLILLSKTGPTNGIEPKHWNVKFNSLWQSTDKEIAERNKLQAEADQININSQVVTPEEVSQSRFGGDSYSLDTKLDSSNRARQAAALEKIASAPAEESSKQILTPTDYASIITVNQALQREGFPEKRLSNGELDPDGFLTVSQYQAKNAQVIVTANAATSGELATNAPATPKTNIP